VPNAGYGMYPSKPSSGWPIWLVERTGAMLRQLADQERSDEVAIFGAVGELATLPGVLGARLVTADTVRSRQPATTAVPVGEDHLLELSGPGVARPELMQTVQVVAQAIAGRLAAPDPSRERRDAIRYAVDMNSLRETEERLRGESARLRTVINSINVGVMLVDEELRVEDVNATALTFMRLDFEPTSLTGVRLPELVERVDPAALEFVRVAIDFAQRGIAGRRPVLAEEITMPNREVYEASYLPVTLDGRTRAHLLIASDVTERAAAQQALEASNRELAELGTLKNQFLATVSHELRTPLTAASSLVEALSTGEVDEQTRDQIIAALSRNTGRLMVIVEYLLVLARLEANTMPLAADPVDTRELLTERVRLLSEEGVPHELTVSHAGLDGHSSMVVGDPDWLAKLVHYVLSGAVATAGSGARIAVHNEVADGHWNLTITGADLPTAESGNVFTAILANTESGQGPGADRIGVGLGLALAQSIAKRHGGELHVEPATTGATITVCLPADARKQG
jgi:signal transduction histidine kinase